MRQKTPKAQQNKSLVLWESSLFGVRRADFLYVFHHLPYAQQQCVSLRLGQSRRGASTQKQVFLFCGKHGVVGGRAEGLCLHPQSYLCYFFHECGVCHLPDPQRSEQTKPSLSQTCSWDVHKQHNSKLCLFLECLGIPEGNPWILGANGNRCDMQNTRVSRPIWSMRPILLHILIAVLIFGSPFKFLWGVDEKSRSLDTCGGLQRAIHHSFGHATYWQYQPRKICMLDTRISAQLWRWICSVHSRKRGYRHDESVVWRTSNVLFPFICDIYDAATVSLRKEHRTTKGEDGGKD